MKSADTCAYVNAETVFVNLAHNAAVVNSLLCSRKSVQGVKVKLSYFSFFNVFFGFKVLYRTCNVNL